MNDTATQQKVTVKFLKYKRTAEGELHKDENGILHQAFEKCIVVDMDSDKVRAIEACRKYPAAVKAIVQDMLDEHQCDNAKIATSLKDVNGKTQFIRTYGQNWWNAENLAAARAARNN